MKPLVALCAGAGALALVLAWLAWPPSKPEPAAESPAPVLSALPVRAAPAAGAATPVSTLPKRDVRAEIQRATAVARVEITLANLDQYLDSLEKRARAQGGVTALEVNPGMSLIEQLTGDMERAGRFGIRMEQLQKELEAKVGAGRPAASPAETAAALDRLAGSIAAEADPARRNQLIGDYVSKARSLEDESGVAAMQRLESLLPKPPTPALDPAGSP